MVLFIVRNILITTILVPSESAAETYDGKNASLGKTSDEECQRVLSSLHPSLRPHTAASVHKKDEVERRTRCASSGFWLFIFDDFNLFLGFNWLEGWHEGGQACDLVCRLVFSIEKLSAHHIFGAVVEIDRFTDAVAD